MLDGAGGLGYSRHFMAMVDSGPPGRGRTIAGKIGLAGTLLITLMVMAAIVLGLGISRDSFDESGVKPDPSAELDNETAGALAQFYTPAATTEGATSIPTPTWTPLPTSKPLSKPMNSTPDSSTASLRTETTQLSATAEAIVATPTIEMPQPMPTPHESYSWTLKVPILMYHYVSNPPNDADKYRTDLSTSPRVFREQMQFLVDGGYDVIDLYDLTLAIVDEGELPSKPIIITFDDGYRDNYENAFPVLQELGLKATFFVATEFIDQDNPNYMSWEMIEEMAAAGMRIEPHSKTHPDLTEHEREFIVWEVLGSQETIASHIGYRPRYFAYPGGRYNDEVQGIVSELDFWGAVTTNNGLWHGFNDRFEWGRVRMRYTTTLAELINMIE